MLPFAVRSVRRALGNSSFNKVHPINCIGPLAAASRICKTGLARKDQQYRSNRFWLLESAARLIYAGFFSVRLLAVHVSATRHVYSLRPHSLRPESAAFQTQRSGTLIYINPP